MKIKSVRIQNFRGFEDETVTFGDHTCLVGPNGAGKSTVLSALNVFFQESSSATETASLVREDFHAGNTKVPIEITVTLYDLSEGAKESLGHYVRQNELLVTTVAVFNEGTGRAPVQQFGERLIFKQFKPYFEDEKNGVLVGPLRMRFKEVIAGLADFPALGASPTKGAMEAALRNYEEERPEICEQERSGDLFYGTTRGKGKLEPFIQWIYIPAVKDASLEGEEAGNTALGKLLQRTVRQKVNFDDALAALNQKTRAEYDALLEKEQGTLKELSTNLAKRLASFAHPDAGLSVEWLQGSEKSVRIDGPRATIKATEGPFKGSLVRFGHGLQRSFLLVILQELAMIEQKSGSEGKGEVPTLILGVEEPELYQHPPQARHLATELRALTEAGNQIIITTHSTYFVSGEAFDEIRLIRKNDKTGVAYATFTDFPKFAKRIAAATGKTPDKPPVARARLMSALRPEPSELYFCKRLVLVEGIEDRAYLASAMHLEEKLSILRRSGLHVLPCDRKSNILQLLAIALELEIPCFVIFDADGDEINDTRKKLHERDNKALLSALGLKADPFPKSILWGDFTAVWPSNLGDEVKAGFDPADWAKLEAEAHKAIDPCASLGKNPVLIAEIMAVAWAAGKKPKVLIDLIDKLVTFCNVP